MTFIPAGELLGETSTVRTLSLAHHPSLPAGDYSLVDAYCTDADCDCRKAMILVYRDRRHVSTINYGWEDTAFYRAWFGAPLDEMTLDQMQGPSIDMTSPNLVSPAAMLTFFTSILDTRYRDHIRTQYSRVRTAIGTKAGTRRVKAILGGNRQAKA